MCKEKEYIGDFSDVKQEMVTGARCEHGNDKKVLEVPLVHPNALQEAQRPKSACGRWSWFNKVTGESSRFFCGSRRCERIECKKMFWYGRVRLLSSLCDEYKLKYFFTLTLDPSNIPDGEDPWRYIPKVWGNFLRVVKRKYPGLKFVAILEKHKDNDRPHIHGFWNRFMSWEWIQKRWSKCKGGEGYLVKEVTTNSNVNEYVAKQLEVHRYVGKDQVNGVPEHVKRTLWRSTGLKAKYELQSSDDWFIIKEDVYDCNGDEIRKPLITEGDQRCPKAGTTMLVHTFKEQ